MTDSAGTLPHDSELAALLDRVVGLAELGHVIGPDAFLRELEALGAELQRLRVTRSDDELAERIEAFAERRFALVDESHEHALAAGEVLLLGSALAASPELATRALKRAVILLSGELAAEGAPRQFKRLLEQLRRNARQLGDAELSAWVAGVVAALPGDEPEPV